MKHAAIAEKLKPYLRADLKDADLIAMDTIFEVGSTSPSLGRDAEEEEKKKKEDAEDKAHDCYGSTEDEWKEKSAEDKKTARDEWKDEEEKKAKDKKAKDAKAKDKKAKDADPDHRKDFDDDKAKDSVTKDEMNAAVKAGVAEARKQAHDAAVAREAVKPICGVIALDAAGMDKAESIYAFALKQAGVKTDGVHPSAYATLLDVVKSRKLAVAPSIALDSAAYQHNVASIFSKPKAA